MGKRKKQAPKNKLHWCAWRLDIPIHGYNSSFNLIQVGGHPSLTLDILAKPPLKILWGEIKQLSFLPFSSLFISLHPQMPNKELENLENPLSSSIILEQGRVLVKRLAWIANQPSYTCSTHLKHYWDLCQRLGGDGCHTQQQVATVNEPLLICTPSLWWEY